MHRACQTGTSEHFVELRLSDNLLQHAIAFFLTNKILFMSHDVDCLTKFHHWLRFSNLICISTPSAKYEDYSHNTAKTIDQDDIEGSWRVICNEPCCNFHTEQKKHNIRPMALLSLVSKEFLVCHIVFFLEFVIFFTQ